MSELDDKLIETTELFGEAYAIAKDAVTERDDLKGQFYKLADLALSEQRLPHKSIEIPASQDVEEYVKKYYPGWRVLQSDPVEEDIVVALIERDPSKMRYTFTNPVTGMTYQRITEERGKVEVDVERLKDEDPRLWQEMSEYPPEMVKLIKAAMKWMAPDWEDKQITPRLAAFLEAEEIERQLKPPVAWSKTQSGRLQKYLIPVPITVKIQPPRQATEEELAELEDDE